MEVPYNPSLIFRHSTNVEAANNHEAITALQSSIDAAQETIDSFLALKRVLEVAMQELINSNSDGAALTEQLQNLKENNALSREVELD